MDQISQIVEKMKEMLVELGFHRITIVNAYRSEINYEYKGLYCIPGYAEGLGFIMEYAYSLEEAQKHWHEDGEPFPLHLGEDYILKKIGEEVSLVIRQHHQKS